MGGEVSGIREAVESDMPRILAMGARSLAEGPYRDQINDNPEAAAKLALHTIQAQNGKLILYEKAGNAIGLLAFFVFPHWLSGEPTATEAMWYVEPEERRSMAAICLFRAGERIAREMGAKRMQFTAPTAEVGRMYELLGYKQLEIGFQKVL